MSEETFNIAEVPIKSLVVPEYCKRRHSSEQIRRCIQSLESHGQYQPIVVSGNEILCGVLIYKSLLKMKSRTIWVHDLGPLSDEKKKEIRYLDNQIFDIETWDEFKIKDLLTGLDRLGVEKAGFTDEEVELFVNHEEEDSPRKSKRDSLFHDQWVCDHCGWTGTVKEK